MLHSRPPDLDQECAALSDWNTGEGILGGAVQSGQADTAHTVVVTDGGIPGDRFLFLHVALILYNERVLFI